MNESDTLETKPRIHVPNENELRTRTVFSMIQF